MFCAFVLFAAPATVAAEIVPVSPAVSALPSPRLTGTPFLSVWRAEDYGASPINWRVLQHPRTGFIYVANNFGVLEFDGATWRLIPLPRGGAVRTLLVDPRGVLWAGGSGELCALEPDPVTGALRAVDRAADLPDYTGPAGVPEVAEPEGDSDTSNDPKHLGVIIRAAVGDDGVYFRLTGGRIARFAGGAPDVWTYAPAMSNPVWFDGALHAATTANGLVRLGPSVAETVGTGRSNALYATRRAPPGWQLFTSRGLYRWGGRDTPLERVACEASDIFDRAPASSAVGLPDGRIAFSSTSAGLFVFDAAGKLQLQLDRGRGLPTDQVHAVCVDRDGGLWLALHLGIARVQLDNGFAVHGAAQGLEGGPRDLFRDGDRLYVTHGEGLAWRDDATGRFHDVAGLRAGSHHLVRVGDRVLMSGSGAFEIVPDGPARRLSNGIFYGVTALPAPAGAGLISLTGSIGYFRSLETFEQRERLTALPVGANAFVPDRDGAVWAVLRTDEIWRIDPRGSLRADSPARRYIPGTGIPPARRRDGLTLLRIGDDLIAASTNWLLRYDAATDRFVPETRLGALPGGRGPIAACSAADGGAWFYFDGPEARLTHVVTTPNRTWAAENFPAHGLGDLTINALFHDTPTRTLWIAGQGALLSFTPGDAPAKLAPLRAVIHDVEDAGGKILRVPANSGASPLSLGPAQTSLRFAFAAPSFEPDYRGRIALQFRTRLDGLEERWTEWTSDARRDFTNLPPGPLTFRVQARDLAGRLSEEASLAFFLAPPWWRTPWAWLGYAATGYVVVFGVVRLRTRALRVKTARLEGVVAARTAELRERNAELARLNQLELDEKISAKLGEEKARLETLRYQLNPHFLFNALNAFPGLVAEQPAAAGRMAISLGDFCRRMLAQHGDEKQRVRDELAMLQAYLDVEKIRFGASLEVEVRADPAALDAEIPAFLLLPLVENAIKHGGATTPGVLRIRLTVEKTPDGLTFEIANTGAWSEKPATGVVSTSIGLENLHRRLARYYAGAHTFTIGQEADWVVARLQLAAAKD